MADEFTGKLMVPHQAVGIWGWGAYVPRYRLPGTEVSRVWEGGRGSGPVREKAVAGLDEDVITMSIEAGRNALRRAGLDAQKLRAVWVGSESHPYAVKPSSTVVAEALGAGPAILAGDWEFACKAGSEALNAAFALTSSGMGRHALAIGMDTAQGKPGDQLEYTAASGGAAFIAGPAEGCAVRLHASYSFVSDTPDFWRRAEKKYPEHGQRFTGEPAYFQHVGSAACILMGELGRKAEDYRFAVFHQPNPKFPQRAAAQLGFNDEQLQTGLLSPRIGNTYAGSALIGLSAILDIAQPGERILMVSYGSGAGSDAFDLEVTAEIAGKAGLAPTTEQYIARRSEIDYATYARMRGIINMG